MAGKSGVLLLLLGVVIVLVLSMSMVGCGDYGHNTAPDAGEGRQDNGTVTAEGSGSSDWGSMVWGEDTWSN